MSAAKRTIGRVRRALSLVELLVAVAALTLISLGVARIFAATGDTLRVGRRVSRINEYAAMLERQLRRDIEGMSREGFLVIRHRLADNGTAIKLVDADTQPRARRVDEILFFKEGMFTSLRDPINPARQATGSAACVYIGHGLRYDEDDANYYSAVQVNVPNRDVNWNIQPSFGHGVNEFASDWILLRHTTVLSGRMSPDKRVNAAGGGDPHEDSEIQVAWQPAASSLFRFQAYETLRDDAAPAAGSLVRAAEANPIRESGVVDVATTDLAEIKSTILDARPIISSNGRYLSASVSENTDASEDRGAGLIRYNPGLNGGTLANPNVDSAVRRMQAWMANALPAESDRAVERRMRAEFEAPDYLGTLGSSGSAGTPYPQNEAWRRTDQTMLTASNFVPRCTEFIVEWSFGNVYATENNGPNFRTRRGEPIWHGLLRRDSTGQTVFARPYLDTNASTVMRQSMQAFVGVPMKHSPAQYPQAVPPATAPACDAVARYLAAQPSAAYAVSQQTIHYVPPGRSEDNLLYSTFGYVDPTYGPGSPIIIPAAINNAITGCSLLSAAEKAQLQAEVQARAGETVDWAWPKLLRITVTLADPQEPGIEQTFEFVYELPERN